MPCRLAGAAGTTATCPLEVVKTRLQVSVNSWCKKKKWAKQFIKPSLV